MSLRIVVFTLLVVYPLVGLPQSTSDTLTSTYVTAVNNWLLGHDKLAKEQLLAMPARSASTEQISAWALLLDEYYFWLGDYQRYLQLADSLHITTGFYSSAKLLAQQPSVHYSLRADSLVIPMRLSIRGHPIIEVKINGQICHLIVDTGAQRTLLSRQFVRKLKHEKLTDVTLSNYDGRQVAGSLLIVDSLTLPNLTIKHLPVFEAQMPLPFIGIDGLLGWDVLRQFAITINYSDRRFTVHRPIHRTNSTVNLLGGSVPMLLAHSMSNNQLNIQFDTGASTKFSVAPVGLAKIGTHHTKRQLNFSSAVGQFMRISRRKVLKNVSVRFDEKAYNFKTVAIFPNDEALGQILRDGLIGSGAFRRGVLMFDAINHFYSFKGQVER
jgi:hypothetical protein